MSFKCSLSGTPLSAFPGCLLGQGEQEVLIDHILAVPRGNLRPKDRHSLAKVTEPVSDGAQPGLGLLVAG